MNHHISSDGSFLHRNHAIVFYLDYLVRSFVGITAKFWWWVCTVENLLTDLVVMGNLLGVLLFVVLFNKLLLLVSDEFPIHFKIASRPNANWLGVACSMVCMVAQVANIIAARIPLQQGSVSSMSVSCIQKVRIILPIIWWIHSIMALAWGFLVVVIGKSLQTILANSSMNSVPQSKVIIVGQGYLVNHVSSTELATIAASLLGISLISNHPVAGSIIVTHHKVSVFFPGRFIVYGPIRLTHNFSHGSASASLIGRCPYFFFVRFVIWHVWHRPQTCATCCRKFRHVKCWRIVCSVLVSPGWHSIVWYHSTTLFWSEAGITIFSLWQMSSCFFPPPKKALIWKPDVLDFNNLNS